MNNNAIIYESGKTSMNQADHLWELAYMAQQRIEYEEKELHTALGTSMPQL